MGRWRVKSGFDTLLNLIDCLADLMGLEMNAEVDCVHWAKWCDLYGS